MPADEVNRPPIARTDIARTRSGVPVLIEVVANDSDPDGDIIAVESIRTQPTGGTARVEDGAVVYTPSDTFAGTDRFTYSLVDAGGEIAIGEVLVGVMPLAGANRAPEAFDDTVEAVAGSAPLVFDVLANDSDPDGDRVDVTTVGTPSSGSTEVAEDGGAVVFTPPADDPRPGTADRDRLHVLDRRRPRRAPPRPPSPSHVIAAAEPIAAGRRRRPGRPAQRPARPSTSTCSPTTSIPTATRPSSPSAPATRRSPTATAASSRSPPARRRAATSTRSPTPPGSPTRPRSPCSSCPTGRRSSTPFAGQTRRQRADHARPRRPGHRPRRRHALLHVLRQPARRRRHHRRPTAPAQLVVTFDPDDGFAGPATFAYTVDDQQGHTVAGAVTVDVLAPANRPPAATDGTFAVEAGDTDEHRPRRRSSPTPTPATRCVRHRRTGRGRRRRSASTAPPCRRRRRSTRGEQTDSFTYTVTDAAGESGQRHRRAHGHAADGAAARRPGPTRRRRTRARRSRSPCSATTSTRSAGA